MYWDEYFVNIAMTVKDKSKDPNSKIGAVIVGKSNEIISTGFNGFCRGINEEVEERWVRPEKYSWVVHAEENVVYNAARLAVSTIGSKLYLVGFGAHDVPCVPCTQCSKAIIQAGVAEVITYAYKDLSEGTKFNKEAALFSLNMLLEAGVQFREFKRH